MSNELTPQEKYPKFYKDPHFWIGAIEVEVNVDTSGTYRRIKKGEIFQLSALALHEFQSMSALQNLTPKFEPQEGDQFIKDLESAVSAGGEGQFKLLSDKLGYKWFIADASDNFHTYLFVTVKNDNIRKVSSFAGDKDMEDTNSRNFNTAAYVDTLRKLGYYL
jgi:hypothetical protein